AELLDAGVDGICVCLLFSYRNAEHEIRVGEILAEEKAKRRTDGQVPAFLSSDLYPQRRDLPRLNSTLIEAYAAEPSRGTLKAVRDKTKEAGAGFELRVMASHGGTISIEARELARTLVSGPIGRGGGGQGRAEVERQLAGPLGLAVDDAAAGVVGLFEQTLKNEAVGRILGKGYSPADYALLCYGGGGPLHVAGYTEGVTYRDVLVPAWAAGF